MEMLLPLKSWNDFERLLKCYDHLLAYEDEHLKLNYQELIFKISSQKTSNELPSITLLPLDLKPNIEDLIKILLHLKENRQLLLYSQKEEALLRDELTGVQNLQNEINCSLPGIFFKTSGTSGKPKFYFFPLEKIFSTALIQANALEINTSEKIGMSLPLFHVSGFMQTMRAFLMGATLYKKDDFIKCSHHLSFVPTQVIRLQKEGALNNAHGKQVLLIGGSKLENSIRQNLEKCHYKVLESYGATETLGFFTLNGELLSHIEFILNEKSEPVLFSENLPEFYIQGGKKFTTNHHQVGITLNDRVTITRNENKTSITVLERNDTIFKVASENINPSLLEHSLRSELAFSETLDFCYLPFPDLEYQNVPVLLVITENNLLDNDKSIIQNKIISYLKNKSTYTSLWWPKKIIFLTSPTHFEQKIGRSHYTKIVENSFLSKIIAPSFIELITMHGFLGHNEEFQTILGPIQNNLPLSLPDKSELDFPELRNPENYFFHLKRLLKKALLSNPTLTLLGYSMGGRILTRALLELLDEIDHAHTFGQTNVQLVLISASLGANNEQEKNDRLKKDQHLLDPFTDKEAFLDFWYGQELFGPKKLMELRLSSDPNFLNRIDFHKETLEKTLSLFSPGLFPTMDETLALIKKHHKKIKQPIQLIVGEKDHKYLEHYLKVLKTNPEIFQLHIIKNAYHDPHRTNPVEITTVLQQILK